MRFILCFIAVLISCTAFAQLRQNVDFFKDNGAPVSSRDSADYIRITREPDAGSVLYKVTEYYANGTPKMAGESVKISPLIFTGQKITYHKNGKKNEVLNYHMGYQVKQQYYYYPNGKFKEERNYTEDEKTREGLFEGRYTVVNYSDSTGKALVTDGSGQYQIENSIATVNSKKKIRWTAQGEVKDGLKQGAWLSSVQNDSLRIVENYDKGKFTSGTVTLASGEVRNYTEPDHLPEFKGGMMAFSKFLGSNLRYPKEALPQRIQGRVNVTFVVEPDGSVSDVRFVGKYPHISLADEAVRAVKASPKWIAGRQFGRVARVSYTVPVVFTLGQ